jgi:hypothetical protein
VLAGRAENPGEAAGRNRAGALKRGEERRRSRVQKCARGQSSELAAAIQLRDGGAVRR